MGVASFYRWLVEKYPKVVVAAVEEEGEPLDVSQPNPNEIEFDNLYLDMNGIVHPCFHPEDQLFPPPTFDEVFTAIFCYIDLIFSIVRPRKLLYMAIDGVAPRAKMNQQRTRRFRTAKDAEIAEAEELRLRNEFESEGKNVLPKQECEVSDSNVITPGTIFMEKLSKALEYYVHLRLSTDPVWKTIKVIISDASVPGEGEHKIMSYIRLQRNFPGYNPNTSHCLYGLDADLIMLALATHEIHFSILREDVLHKEEQNISSSSIEANLSRKEFSMVKSSGWFGKVLSSKGRDNSPRKPYQFLHIWTLREYLEIDMKPESPDKIDVERIIDDFVFICFLTGNDFLPHQPSIEIHEMAIDLLITVYKKMFNKLGGYLIDTSKLNEKKAPYIKVKRFEQFIHEVGTYEERIFEKRYKLQQKNIQRWLIEQSREEADTFVFDSTQQTGYNNPKYVSRPLNLLEQFETQTEMRSSNRGSDSLSTTFSEQCTTSELDIIGNTKEMRTRLKDILREKMDLFKNGAFKNDKVKLGVPGWKDRYYREKFGAESPSEIESTRKEIVQKYMEGVCWVLQYYFVGICSWGWYYPFNYAPFVSDLKSLSCSNTAYKLGSPFKPFDQLMAVLPPRSSHALPEAYRGLMISEESSIINFYPDDFMVDMDGKRFAWQGIVKLPFIDEGLLLRMTRSLEKSLNRNEVKRNTFKADRIIVTDLIDLGKRIRSIYDSSKNTSETSRENYPIDSQSFEINGYISLLEDYHINHFYGSPISVLEDLNEDLAISAIFKNPDYHDHVPKLLQDVIMPVKTVTEGDIVDRKLWHEYERSQPQHNSRYAASLNTRWSSASTTSSGELGLNRGYRGFVPNSRKPGERSRSTTARLDHVTDR